MKGEEKVTLDTDALSLHVTKSSKNEDISVAAYSNVLDIFIFF